MGRNKITIKDAVISIISAVDFIAVKDVIEKASKITGYSKLSVRGTSFGSTDKFMTKEWFFNNYIYYPQQGKTPAMIFKKNYLNLVFEYKETKPITKCYNSNAKKLSREYIYKNIIGINKPKIITFGGEHGLDIKYIFSINKDSNIDNIEFDKHTFLRYKKLKLNTNDFNLKLYDFLKCVKDNNFYNLINYDSTGYLSKSLAKSLSLINKYKNTDELYLTMQDIKKIRNHGEFANRLRINYKNYDDPTLSYIKDIMPNYTYISEYKYKQETAKKGMRILNFKLK